MKETVSNTKEKQIEKTIAITMETLSKNMNNKLSICLPPILYIIEAAEKPHLSNHMSGCRSPRQDARFPP